MLWVHTYFRNNYLPLSTTHKQQFMNSMDWQATHCLQITETFSATLLLPVSPASWTQNKYPSGVPYEGLQIDLQNFPANRIYLYLELDTTLVNFMNNLGKLTGMHRQRETQTESQANWYNSWFETLGEKTYKFSVLWLTCWSKCQRVHTIPKLRPCMSKYKS